MKKAFGSLWFNSLLRKVAEVLALTSRLIVQVGIAVVSGMKKGFARLA
jgi:hypothetical protein